MALLFGNESLANSHRVNGFSNIDHHDAYTRPELIARLTNQAKGTVCAAFGCFGRKQLLHRGPVWEVGRSFDLQKKERPSVIPSDRSACRNRAINGTACQATVISDPQTTLKLTPVGRVV